MNILLGQVPTEIWLHIFHPLVHISILPNESDTILQQLALFTFRSAPWNPIAARDAQRTNLSLVCRHFYQILRQEMPHVAVVNRMARLEKYRSHDLVQSHRLELMRSVDLISRHPLWLSWDWPELQVMVGKWTDDDARIILDHTPNLKVLEFNLSYCRPDEITELSVLHHPVVHQLTHLSIKCLIDTPQQTIHLPYLRFLSLDVSYGHIKGVENMGTTLLPWTFPRLRSLVIRGTIGVSTRDALTPFFDAHSSSVTRLIDEARVSQGTRNIPTEIISHFPSLCVYGVDLPTFVSGTLPANIQPSPTARPLTVIPLQVQTALSWWDTSATLAVLKRLMKYVKSEGTYIPKMIMLGERWEDIDTWLQRTLPERIELFLKMLVGFDSPECPVVDRDMVCLRSLRQFSSAQAPS